MAFGLVLNLSVASPPVPPSTIFTADFTAATLGAMTNGSFASTYGLAFARASVATVQTGAATMDSTPTNDQPRIGSTGASWGQGLVIEETRTNAALHSRVVSSFASAGSGDSYTHSQVGPDGSAACDLCTTASSASFTHYQSVTAGMCTMWVKDTVPSGSLCGAMCTAAAGGTDVTTATTQVWARYSHLGASTFVIPIDTGGPGAAARSQLFDFVQVESGKLFATEAIVTVGTTVARAGENLQIASGATLIDTNRLSLAMRFVAKGTPTQYSASAYLWHIDANNAAWIDTSQKLNVMLGGTTRTSASAIAWSAGDVVDVWVACGAGSNAVVEYRLNGGAGTTLINTALAGNPSGAGAIDLFCSGTGGQLSAWVQKIVAYKSGKQPSWVT